MILDEECAAVQWGSQSRIGGPINQCNHAECDNDSGQWKECVHNSSRHLGMAPLQIDAEVNGGRFFKGLQYQANHQAA